MKSPTWSQHVFKNVLFENIDQFIHAKSIENEKVSTRLLSNMERRELIHTSILSMIRQVYDVYSS